MKRREATRCSIELRGRSWPLIATEKDRKGKDRKGEKESEKVAFLYINKNIFY
jgi:hypothetical protein